MFKQELLAPAGDIEAGYAALYYGADAVYLGLSKFSARATATNFDEPTLDEFTAYAHSLKRKVYVALNTLLQESELDGLIESLDICTRCKVDGLIIQDLGVARVMKEKYPHFEMHASTQMAVHNREGALYLKKLGFKRVVLARELTVAEIKEIAAIPDLETEAFIHGALCYSYSGLCMFSSVEYARSANRGKCLYPCRAAFKCNGNKESHLFSMKDMALQEEVLNMPVSSLKIEGRKKSALYVAAVTDYYRRILDGKGADKNREEHIKQIFSRPWCKFHFKGKDKNIIDRDFVGHRGLLIGNVENVSHGRVKLVPTHKIARYDGLQFDAAGDEKPFGFSAQKIFVGGKNVFEVKAGQTAEIELPHGYPTLKKGDKVYLASSGEVKGAYHYEKPKPREFRNKYDIEVDVYVSDDKITAKCGNFEAMVEGVFSQASEPNKSKEAIEKAFAKTGDTPFNLKTINVHNEKGLFAPASMLNELRRDLYSRINIKRQPVELPSIFGGKRNKEKQLFIIKTDDLSYLDLLDWDKFAEIIYLINPHSDTKGLAKLPKNKIRIALPAVCRNPILFADIINRLLDSGYSRWEAANWWALEILPCERLDISFDSSMYMLNTQAISNAAKMGASCVTLSLEDNKVNICNIVKKSKINTQLIVYQDIPLFTSVGCIRNNDCAHCNQQPMWFDLERDGRKFKALSNHCQMMVFDDKPLCIAKEAKDVEADYLRMDFIYRRYTAEKVKNIVEKILQFENVSNCININFLNNNL
ncbi:MAG: U32 family peptidase [Alphaproteobacteria bacterium]|nr:U32 family peptidase [Alphaproteobacteria bacterium]